jgi:hypothetical protein
MRLGKKEISPTRVAVMATRCGLTGPWNGSIWYTEERGEQVPDELLVETGYHFSTSRTAIDEMERMLAGYFNLPRGTSGK